MKTEDVLEALAKEGATLRLADLPNLGSPRMGDAEHSQYFFWPLPLPFSFLPLPSPPPLGVPHDFDGDWPGIE